ncbi:MAG: FtsX-like permease family protein, partial [Gemmatimonadetes bacterium]|nr:FtsX-like permease family protein [Gemmatimonadota bacterium]
MSEKAPLGLGTARRVYRGLLRFFPRLFRDSFSGEAEELFDEMYREAHRRGGLPGSLVFCAKALVGSVFHGPAERWALRDRAVASGGAGGSLGRDARFALRTLRRAPVFTTTAALILALGMGSTIALYSLVAGVLIQPLPYADAEELVLVWESGEGDGQDRQGPSPLNVIDWREASTSFTDLAAWYLTSGTFRGDDIVEENRSAQVTTSFFRVLGVAPQLGRDFAEEEGAPYGPVILSHSFWQRVFGGDPSAVGRSMELSGVRYEIVGVMPPGFAFPDPTVEYWMAWDLRSVYGGRPETRTWRFLRTVARLSPGQSVEAAQAELSTVQASLAERFPAENRGWEVAVTPLQDEVVGQARPTLWMAMGAVGALLLLACANVANLLLAQAAHRGREMAVRQAVGAGRPQLVRQLVVENLVLASVSGVLGIVFGWGLIALVKHLDPGQIPRLAEVSFNAPVLGFAVGLVFLTSLLFGIAPAAQLVLRRGQSSAPVPGRVVGQGRELVRRGLVALQIGLALALLVSAGLFAQSLERLQEADLGFASTGALTFRVSLDADQIDGAGDISRYYEQLLDRIRVLPGVVSTGAAQTLPINPVGNDFARPYRPLGSTATPADAPTVALRIATADYLTAAGMRFLSGGPFSAALGEGDPRVAVVNETLAQRLWPDRDPVGESFEIDFREGWRPYRVVGVIADVRHAGPRRAVVEEAYLSQNQSPYLAMSVVV